MFSLVFYEVISAVCDWLLMRSSYLFVIGFLSPYFDFIALLSCSLLFDCCAGKSSIPSQTIHRQNDIHTQYYFIVTRARASYKNHIFPAEICTCCWPRFVFKLAFNLGTPFLCHSHRWKPLVFVRGLHLINLTVIYATLMQGLFYLELGLRLQTCP